MNRFRKTPTLFFIFIYCWATATSQSLTHCSLHYYDSNWQYALHICETEQKSLLCYKSMEEIQRIVDNFFPQMQQNMHMKFWLSAGNCATLDELTECLSLNIERTEGNVWHYFQTNCNPIPFICCNIEQVTTSMTATTPNVPSSSVSEEINFTTYPISTVSTTEAPLPTSTIYIPSTSSVVKTTTTVSLSCKSVEKRGIVWPDAPAGTTVTVPCPGNSIGNATWLCDSSNGTWVTPNPDMSQCHSAQLKSIKDKFDVTSSGMTISELSELFEDHSEVLQGNDLKDAMFLLSLLPDKLFKESASLNDSVRWQVAVNSVTKSMSVFNEMMDLETWEDISLKEVRRVGSQLLSAADHFGFFLADTIGNKAHHSIINDNIALEILKQEYGQSVSLPLDFSEHQKHGHITLNSGYDKFLQPNNGPVSIIYIYYADMSSILLSESTGLLNSPVVSTSITQGGLKPMVVSSQVHVLVEHLYVDKNNTACVFWNLRRHTWDPTGCHLKATNSTHTLCECNHLTNFAVLMDYKGVLIDMDDTPLFYITVIGCSMSIVGLVICIAVFTCYRWQKRNAWGVRYSIHRNLCITLLLANVLLITGLNQTQNHVMCAIIAGFLHYFFLSAFCWMLLEGVHIYVLLVIVFASKKTHSGKYYIFGYGFPLIIISITAAVKPDSYGTTDSCWLSVDDGAVWSFTGPVACILLVNSAALLLAQLKASKISVKDDNIAIIKRWLRVTFILFPILGLTWVLGFLYVGKNFVIVAYIFAILNSLQGFCIFICHCLMDKNARTVVLNSIRKKIAAVETESTATNKRSNKESNKGLINARGRFSSASSGPKKWHLWQKPWAFCFTLNFTTNVQVQPSSESDEVATVLHWRKLHESDPV